MSPGPGFSTAAVGNLYNLTEISDPVHQPE
jgi:hypothetical protein